MTLDDVQRQLRESRGTVAIAGGRTEVATPPPADLLIETRRFDRVLEYAPSDQVVIAECGMTLAALQRDLAKNGQRLALDPPYGDRATLGGIVASNSYGPLRTRYGSVRDLIIGISILRADGTRAKGGGKVVKTVAGFDLPKLMCGSRGTLAMIATVTFRVHPLPEATTTVVARGVDAAGVIELVRTIRRLQLEPAAMMARHEAGKYEVWIRFEGFGAGVRAQRGKLRELDEAAWPSGEPAGAVRFGALPTDLPKVEKALRGSFFWYPTLGLGFTDATQHDDFSSFGGWIGRRPPSSPGLHQAVKSRLDPDGRFPRMW
jgi:glycolate oxidase FAD binding subunit